MSSTLDRWTYPSLLYVPLGFAPSCWIHWLLVSCGLLLLAVEAEKVQPLVDLIGEGGCEETHLKIHETFTFLSCEAKQNLFMASYYDTNSWETASKRPLLASCLSVWIPLFSLLNLSLQLGYTDVRPLVVLRGVGLEKWGLQIETCDHNTVSTLREGETQSKGVKDKQRVMKWKTGWQKERMEEQQIKKTLKKENLRRVEGVEVLPGSWSLTKKQGSITR